MIILPYFFIKTLTELSNILRAIQLYDIIYLDNEDIPLKFKYIIKSTSLSVIQCYIINITICCISSYLPIYQDFGKLNI